MITFLKKLLCSGAVSTTEQGIYCTLSGVGDAAGHLTSVNLTGADLELNAPHSIAEILNFMAEHRWQFVHSSVTPTSRQDMYCYHFLLRKDYK